MKNPSVEVLESAVAMRNNDGTPIAEILEATGLNYSQFWLHWAAGEVQRLDIAIEPTGNAIVEARNAGGDHSSWGWLAVRASIPESRVRKLFTDASNIDHMGLRIGKGGRYVEGNPQYYANELKRTGLRISPKQVRAQALADYLAGGDLTTMNYQTLRAMARKRGMKLPKGTTKADIIDWLNSNR